MRIDYPPNIRIVRVPCTGRVDVIHMLRAIEKGADGVMVSGCLVGNCHHRSGNSRAMKRVARVKEILESVRVNPDRVEMFLNSSTMGPQFAENCRTFTERVRGLGPGLRRVSRKAGEGSARQGA